MAMLFKVSTKSNNLHTSAVLLVNLLPKTNFIPTFNMHRVESNDTNLWHRRLGHPNFHVVQTVMKLRNPSISSIMKHSFCNFCQIAKSHRLSFPSSLSRALKPFDLIHTDLWGPAIVNSLTIVRYFILFIDDHTRFTWLYLLKTKDEAYSTFLKFKAFVETQLNAKIRQVQSDGGEREFRPLHKFF